MQVEEKCQVMLMTAILLISIGTVAIGSSFGGTNFNDDGADSAEMTTGKNISKDVSKNDDKTSKVEVSDDRNLKIDGNSFYPDHLSKGKYQSQKKKFKDRLSEGKIKKEDYVNVSNYEDHRPIRIDNGSEFAEIANKENWTGNGTENNPYLIQGYDIDAKGHGFGIFIGNVTVNFTIKDCYIHNASGKNFRYFENTGLYLYNVSSGRIESNVMLYNQNGVTLSSSRNVTIIDNIIISKSLQNSQPDRYEALNFKNFPRPDTGTVKDPKDGKGYSKDSVLVKLKSEPGIKSADKKEVLKEKAHSIAEDVGGSTSRIFKNVEAAQIKVDEDRSVMGTVKLLERRPEVEYAEPNYDLHLNSVPNDPGFGSLWGLQQVRAPDAWNTTKGSGEVVIGVIDTGVDYNHPDLKDNIWTGTTDNGTKYHGYNAINESYYPIDDYGHGTHVAGTIGAVGDNGIGVTGMNWNVSIMPLKFLGSSGGGTTADAIDCLDFVLEKKKEGVNVVATSNSWGGGGKSMLLKEAIARHRDNNILFVAAAGNAYSNIDRQPTYPASYDLTNIVSVAATNQEDKLASFSNYGNRSVHVAAPGVDINSTLPGGEYGKYDGTSMAAPHVSGLVGLLAAHNSSYDYNNLKNILLSSGDHLKSLENLTMTESRINASKALNISPDPDEVNLRVHRPLISIQSNRETDIMISLDNGVEPILGANVTVDINANRETLHLQDNGTGADQSSGDGYYTAAWTPTIDGEIILNVSAEIDGRKLTKEIKVNVWGVSALSIVDSNSTRIVNNTAARYDLGMSLISSSDIEVLENNVTSNKFGIEIYKSGGNRIADNLIHKNSGGLMVEKAGTNTVTENSFIENSLGIYLLRADNNSVSNNNLTKQLFGMQLRDSDMNTISKNKIVDGFYGLVVLRSSGTDITSNMINTTSDKGWQGTLLMMTNETTFRDNKVQGYLYGLFVNACNGSVISSNNFGKNLADLYTYNSLDTSIKNNSMSRGIVLFGERLDHWTSHNISETNKVDGEPVYYKKNMNGGSISKGGGQLILANCTDVDVKNLNIDGSYIALTAGFSRDNNISLNDFSNNSFGVGLANSHNNAFFNNRISSCNATAFSIMSSDRNEFIKNELYNDSSGLGLQSSSQNLIAKNNMYNNRYGGLYMVSDSGSNTIKDNTALNNSLGFYLSDSSDNVVFNNTLKENLRTGVYLRECSGNTLYHNNFLDNRKPARDEGENQWYKDLEGNYWSNYKERYPGAVKLEDMGIWNKSYNLTGNKKRDKYPLIEPTKPVVSLEHPPDEGKLKKENITIKWSMKYLYGDRGDYEISIDGGDWIEMGEKNQYNLTGLSEGDHSVRVRIIGLEKISMDKARFTIDTIPPTIDITFPKKDEFKKDSLKVEWKASSNGTSIDHFEAKAGNREWAKVGKATSHQFSDLKDGKYNIEIRAVDEAGNTAKDFKPVMIDTQAPEIDITSPGEKDLVNDEKLKIQWESTDEVSGVDHYEVKLANRDKVSYMGTDNQYVFENLEDGNHTIKVRSFDELENEAFDTITFTLDTADPEVNITSPQKEKVFEEKNLKVEWNGSDELTGIDHYEVRIDGGNWKTVEDNTTFSFKDLEDGSHTVEVRAWDKAGNNYTKSISFEVDTTNWLLIGLAIAAGVGVPAAGLLFMRHKKSESFEDLEEDEAEFSDEEKAKKDKEWKREENDEESVESFYEKE